MIKWIVGILIIGILSWGILYALERGAFRGNSVDEEIEEETHNQEVVDITPEVIDAELINTDWVWTHTDLPESNDFLAPEGGEFVLRFSEEGTVTSTTDCNSMSGQYTNDGEVLSFGSFVSTLMLCEDSVETEYAEFLSYTSFYSIEENVLRLNLARDVGVMVFVKEN